MNQTTFRRLCCVRVNLKFPEAALPAWCELMIYSFIVTKAGRVLTMSIHSVKHITFSNSFSPRKNQLWHMLSLSHFINEEIKAQEYQANCPWSHSDKWPNQGWMAWFWSQTSSHAGATQMQWSWWRCWYYQSSCFITILKKHKTTYMEHLGSSF